MKLYASRTRHRQLSRQGGQTIIFVVLVVGLFLLGFIGFAVDFANLWFHRQSAQGAADAACQAGAMNLLVSAEGNPTSTAGFNPADGDFDCASSPAASPCKYAALNGYSGTGLTDNTESNGVNVKFPGSVSGVTTPPSTVAPVPFIRVDVVDRVRVYFARMITGNATQDVVASSVCGLQEAKSPIPIIVQNPTCQHSFQVSGSSTLKIIGGPTKSVQVNSVNDVAACGNNSSNQCNGSGTVDLSRGGPSYSGSSFGTYGGPASTSVSMIAGGTWAYPASPIGDPFARVPDPSAPVTLGTVTHVAYHDALYGCPDTAGCLAYTPGYYNKPIVVDNETAVFVPGLYYINPSDWTSDFAATVRGSSKSARGGGLCGAAGSGCTSGGSGQCLADFLVSNRGIVRMANGTLTGDGSQGMTMYMSGTGGSYGSVVVAANAGGRTAGVDAVPSTSLTCDGTLPPTQLGIPANMNGNILVGPCTSKGTYIGAPTETAGNIRGLLLYQDRHNGYQNGQANMQGGGGLAISGTLYAHQCPGSPSCDPTTDYKAFLQLQGGSCSDTYLLGEIVSDQFVSAGNGCVNMSLNPNAVYDILKVAMLK